MVQRPPPSIDPRQRIFVRLLGSLLTRTQYIVIDLTIPCIILRIFNKDDQDFFPMDLSYVLARTSSREDHWVPQDFDPIACIDASPRKINYVLIYPTASNVLASASSEHAVKLWDLADTDRPRSVLTGHNDTIQCLTFNSTGTLMAILFDPRAGGEAVHITEILRALMPYRCSLEM
ncbi:hypothetical protein DFJ58DRAFT_870117 [Suillus subalutaceus]|nr:uncharacterized protein DFJ58DRAFT_870117 [Suillus subalutaceus]KAG1833202.1 hypothetical protein DFJ58DRAFT_870117 [Suillus subalutaceus]